MCFPTGSAVTMNDRPGWHLSFVTYGTTQAASFQHCAFLAHRTNASYPNPVTKSPAAAIQRDGREARADVGAQAKQYCGLAGRFEFLCHRLARVAGIETIEGDRHAAIFWCFARRQVSRAWASCEALAAPVRIWLRAPRPRRWR